MSIVYVTLINVILLFIAYLVLNHKINKNSTSALLDRYAREVESLIVELNRTLDDVLNLSEERVSELKKLIKKAEKTLASDRHPQGALSSGGAGLPVSNGATPLTAAGGVATDAGDGGNRGVQGAQRGKRTEAKPARRDTEGGDAGGSSGDSGRGPRGGSDGRIEGSGENTRPTGAAQAAVTPARVPPARVPPAGAPPVSVPLYDMRGRKVDVPPQTQEGRRENPRTSNIFERTRHLLSMGHSKEEIARMLNLSRAEMEFLASLHNK